MGFNNASSAAEFEALIQRTFVRQQRGEQLREELAKLSADLRRTLAQLESRGGGLSSAMDAMEAGKWIGAAKK